MGKPPAYLFVVRHGLRLDVADKNWHLTSPTPYDPPLTYSGWNQAKNLGARIGNIIRERVKEDETAAKAAGQTNPTAKPKRKRYEVVIHSSPFLRCIQTSVAISAGLAQDSAPFGPSTGGDNKELSGSFAHSHRARPSTASDPGNGPAPLKIVQGPVIRKSVLRLDAFLGEWLSPGYYEFISPPPESVMMLASAKADLLRREDYSSYPNFNAYNHSNLQGQLWSPTAVRTHSPLSPTISSVDPLEKDDLSSVASSLPRSESASSQSTCQSQPDSIVQSATQPFPAMGYVPPVPHYAVNNNNTIPLGYVAHARDACCDIDYQWDSMRAPLNWGDGGSFPEEWTSMHRRFGAGIQMLVDWYSTAEHPTKMVTKTVSRFGRPVQAQESDDSEDVETEAIVILVSHGAGCNALIGAITHQPVLADVAMASLTMAVRKPDQELHESIERCQKEKTPIHHYYDLKLFANTDHLRTPGQAPNLSRSTSISIASVAAARNRYTHSHSISTSSTSNFSYQDIVEGRGGVSNSPLSASRRGSSGSSTTPRFVFGTSNASNGNGGGITVGSGVSSFGLSKPSSLSTGLGRKPSMGLWSPTSLRNSTGFDDDDDDDNMVLNFGTPANDKPSTMKS
ncbi:hypothetical protein SMACR_00793 [Sordaria macrospora]|uniref:WGS project CABT00000000 data, contig 2.2 n=2 Tax=Sordaria macrospora TaxID=5147 RepID=F7VN33_SORMK|nr:uncharacterized protein SMAC_00793 [Sordaria macrospora k-hell]KAA8634725.1 hypothetical protein SMACR_00793 [Sordaria macrospora]KAH7631114.1 hypothetical protein B0T09DRAFT_130282 [Sordaria sp. MPI-SDFR-AT-0083]WPJ61785.1 hypothetical protein SMAC4_00793 [Sordaria macrospora]CCC06762.1 unnamed protein product [Sordaria macrospora k-hell]